MMARKKKKGRYAELGTLVAEVVFNHLSFVVFLCFLGAIYISNAHLAQKQVRTIQEMREEVQHLRREYHALKSELMYHSRLSEMEKRVAPLGLRKPKEEPRIIVVEGE